MGPKLVTGLVFSGRTQLGRIQDALDWIQLPYMRSGAAAFVLGLWPLSVRLGQCLDDRQRNGFIAKVPSSERPELVYSKNSCFGSVLFCVKVNTHMTCHPYILPGTCCPCLKLEDCNVRQNYHDSI